MQVIKDGIFMITTKRCVTIATVLTILLTIAGCGEVESHEHEAYMKRRYDAFFDQCQNQGGLRNMNPGKALFEPYIRCENGFQMYLRDFKYKE